MKRSLSFVASATALIAATYGLVRLAYGLYLPDMQRDLGFDAGTAGLISAGASLVYCLAAATGFLAGARHPRSLVVAAGITAGTGCLAMTLAPGTGMLAAGAVLSSAAAGFASPAVVALVDRNTPAAARDRAQNAANAGTGPGLVVAGLLALVLLPQWRAGWLVAGIATAVAAVLVLAGDRRPGTGAPTRALPPVTWFAGHRAPLAAALLLGAGSAAVWSYGRSLLAGAGSPGNGSTVAWIALGIGGAAVLLTSRWTVRLPVRTAWWLTSGAVAAATLALPAVADRLPVAAGVCALFGWGYTAATGVLISWTARIDPARAASGTAALFVTLVLGQAIGAAGAGALSGGGTAFVAAGFAGLVAAAAGWWARVPVRTGSPGSPADGPRPAGSPGRAPAGRAGRPSSSSVPPRAG